MRTAVDKKRIVLMNNWREKNKLWSLNITRSLFVVQITKVIILSRDGVEPPT